MAQRLRGNAVFAVDLDLALSATGDPVHIQGLPEHLHSHLHTPTPETRTHILKT